MQFACTYRHKRVQCPGNIDNLELSSETTVAAYPGVGLLLSCLTTKPTFSSTDFFKLMSSFVLSCICKVLRADRLICHCYLSPHSLYFPFQSAYRNCQSTVTLLLAVHDISSVLWDKGKITALIILDLSLILLIMTLLYHLEPWFGLSGAALSWFASYLHTFPH